VTADGGAYCGPLAGHKTQDASGYFVGCGAELVVISYLNKKKEPQFCLLCPNCDRQDLLPLTPDDPVTI